MEGFCDNRMTSIFSKVTTLNSLRLCLVATHRSKYYHDDRKKTINLRDYFARSVESHVLAKYLKIRPHEKELDIDTTSHNSLSTTHQQMHQYIMY